MVHHRQVPRETQRMLPIYKIGQLGKIEILKLLKAKVGT